MKESPAIKNPFTDEAFVRLEQRSSGYHLIGCWVAVVLNPVFILTDYLNLPQHWQDLLIIRLLVSALILLLILFKEKWNINSSLLIVVPLMLISLQNAYVYSFLGEEDLLGQHLNYMALFIGASMFILWRWTYSLAALIVSALGTTWFVHQNSSISYSIFFLHGGLLLLATGIFMILLIQTRYKLTFKNIRSQLELEESKMRIELQAKEIHRINESLEKKVQERTQELQNKNKILEKYAFVNSHELRGPIASIMGLVKLFSFLKLDGEQQQIVDYLNKSTQELDQKVRGISDTIAKGRGHDH